MPGGLYCCVNGCYSNTKHHKKSFYRLPAEQEKLEVWLPVMKREDLFEKSKIARLNQRICSDHFYEEDFTSVKTLNKDAIPRLRLPNSQGEERSEASPTSLGTDTLNSKKCKENSTQTDISESMNSSSQICEAEQQNTNEKCIATFKTTELLHKSRKRKLTDVTISEEPIESEEKKILVKDEDITEELITKKTFLDWCHRFLNEKMSNIVKCHVSLIDMYKGNQYTMDFKLFSQHIYYCSPHAYRHLQQVLDLPSIRTLRTMQIPISSGVNELFLKALKYKRSELTEQESICTVSIGAMSLKPHLCYEVDKDKIHGLHEIDNLVTSVPAEYAVVIMVRGIFHEWKQPIGYAFIAECKDYPEMGLWIDKVIHTLLEIGFDVRAVISDLGSEFLNASKARTITAEHTWFEIYGKKIYCIFDAPSLMKYARNNLMEYDFQFGTKMARWQHIEQAYVRDNVNDLKLMQKVTEKHVKPNDSDKLEVKLATQIFSKTVAAAMNVYAVAELIDHEAKGTVELIRLFNNLFDMLNSASVLDDDVYKRAYQGTDEQKHFFVEAIQFFKRLNLKHKNNSLMGINFIKGFIISIKSIMSLFEDLKLEGHNFLLTRNTNLDCLEEFFGQIRERSGNCTEPTAFKFSRAFQKLVSVNTLKPTKEDSREDQVNSVLSKVYDYINRSNEDSKVSVSETPEQASLKIDTTDYKLDMPQRNAYMYVTGYLLRKCLEKHSCPKLVAYFDALESGLNHTTETLYVYINTDVGVIATSENFINLVKNLENTLKDFFNRNKDNMSQNLGNSLLADMRQIAFEMPCECFPLDFLKKLFIRLRIFTILKDNNKVLKLSRHNRNYISVSQL